MGKCFALALLCMFCVSVQGYSQEDTSVRSLKEVILSANKWEQVLNEVPNKVVKVNKMQILRNNPQTSADLLGQTGTVFIQKSQLGGGSPMIRGFATNRVLLVVDGVRTNNAIYRSGNLQNIISIDALSTETAEVIFGPGSLIYGSDAIGGVMDFHSLESKYSPNDKTLVRANVVSRYSTANNEKTVHADLNLGWKKFSLLSSVTYSDFDDLKMGKYGGQDSYGRREYVERQGSTDVIVNNPDPRIQRFSGYKQLNFLQKIRYKAGENLDLQYSFNYAGTGEAARYDRLIQYRNNALRFAEWNYGPMMLRMHQLRISHSKKNAIYDNSRFIVAYQNYEESRVDRTRNNNNRNLQLEHVNAINLNWDAWKAVGKGRLFYGAEYVHNKVGSMGERTNIINGNRSPYVSRYPDGSTWSTSGVYGSYKINPSPKFTLTTGLRFSYNTLDAKFDTTFIKFPYGKAELRDGGITGNAGLVFRPAEGWQINSNISTGYRMPNVDDIGKLFESVPGNITVPNPSLQPEYAWNFELGIIRNITGRLHIEVNGFYTILNNAIVRRPSAFLGQDSILFDGTLSRVEALQNVARASVWGLQVSAEYFILDNLSVQTHANWIDGKETDDLKDEQVSLRHAPPFYGKTSLRFHCKRFMTTAYADYNSEISNAELAPSEQGKTDIYAKDENDLPYSPGWYTVNLKTSYQLNAHLMFTASWENITNQRYRPYSSGIVSAGSNFIFSLRASL